ncbi:MAG: Holliday junction branch migration protein RuvA, partial [Actinomycetota bacterium]
GRRMIGSLRGRVLERISDQHVLIEVQGVGYVVSVTPRTLAELEPTTDVFLHVHHHIREDHQTLFGFLSRDERATFQMLVSAHGVGPTLALAVLGTHEPGTLMDIIASQDIASLTLVPGVGKKTAERLLVELKNRVVQLDSLVGAPGAASTSSSADVRQALSSLGYSEAEIRDAMRGIDPHASSSDLLREALRVLGVRRA